MYMLLTNRLLLYFLASKYLFLDHFVIHDYEHLVTMWVLSLAHFWSFITQRSGKVNDTAQSFLGKLAMVTHNIHTHICTHPKANQTNAFLWLHRRSDSSQCGEN